jgi:hypothetical protein
VFIPLVSKPQVPISGLGFAGRGFAGGVVVGAGIAVGAAGLAEASMVGGAVGVALVVAGLLDPQPAVVARMTANIRVFTFSLRDWW